MTCSCDNIVPNEITVGTKVHEKEVRNEGRGRVRINSECPSWVQYISPRNVVVSYYTKRDGRFISEHAYTRDEFDEKFEYCPVQTPEPTDVR